MDELKAKIIVELVKNELVKKYKINSRIANMIVDEAIKKMNNSSNFIEAAMSLMKMENELNELFSNIETIKNFEKLVNW